MHISLSYPCIPVNPAIYEVQWLTYTMQHKKIWYLKNKQIWNRIDKDLTILSPLSQQRHKKFEQEDVELVADLDKTINQVQHDYNLKEVIDLYQIIEKESNSNQTQ